MKEIKQLLFVYDGDIKEIGDLPYAFITFNNDFEPYSSQVLSFDNKDYFDKKNGNIQFIDELMSEYLFEYKVKILKP